MLLFLFFFLINRVLNVYLNAYYGIALIGQYFFQPLVCFRLSESSATLLSPALNMRKLPLLCCLIATDILCFPQTCSIHHQQIGYFRNPVTW